MSTLFLHLFFGPLLLILSYLFKRFPPKKINHLYGYRTPRSMQSQEAWNCANQYFTNAFTVVALATCLVQILAYALIEGDHSILWAAGFLILGVIATIPLTEMHLKSKGF